MMIERSAKKQNYDVQGVLNLEDCINYLASLVADTS